MWAGVEEADEEAHDLMKTPEDDEEPRKKPEEAADEAWERQGRRLSD